MTRGSPGWLDAYLERRLRSGRHPISGTLELSFRCNFNCRHCYLRGSRRCRELDEGRWRKILSELAAAGVLGLTFTGGEPLLRSDFASIYRQALRRGFLITIFSNGSLLTDALADLFADFPPQRIEISLYGWGEDTYRRVTGSGRNFGRVMAGLERLAVRRLPVALKAMLMAPLTAGVERMRRLAADFGFPFSLDAGVDPTLRSDPSPTALRLDPRKAVALELRDRARRQRLGRYHRRYAKNRRGKTDAACGAGHSSFNIDPAGRLSACLMLRRPAVSLLEEGFRAAWERLGRGERPGRLPDHPCGDCRLKHLCSYCPGLSRLGEDPRPGCFHCRLAEARAAALEKPERRRAA